MKKAVLILGVAGLATGANAELFSYDFEADSNQAFGFTAEDSFATNIPVLGGDGSGDFFGITDAADTPNIHGGFVDYSSGADGQFFATMDPDSGDANPTPPGGPGSPGHVEPFYLTFATFNLNGADSVDFSVDLAEDDDGLNQDWDELDFVNFQISLDGGAFTNIMSVGIAGTGFNQEPEVSGTAVTSTWATFNAFGINTSGFTTAAIRVEISLDSGDEDIAIDNLTVTPAPGAVALLGLAGLAGVRRRR